MWKLGSLISICIAGACVVAIEDKSCIKTDGTKGVCVSIFMCDEALEELKDKRNVPQTCGFKKKVPLVCCNPYGIISKKKCAEYHDIDYYDDRTRFVMQAVGGEDALSQEFPHMAVLGFGSRNNIAWNCGGTLISEQHVLTAAHCLYSQELGYVKFVRLGDLNLAETNDSADPQEFLVAKMYRHPDYKPPVRYHDIAILQLDRPVNITLYVTPACLNTKRNLSFIYPVATGWGKLSYGGQTSPHLQKVYLEMYNYSTCRNIYRSESKRQLPKGLWEETQLCAGSPTEVRDTCQGDSGGPLQIHHEKITYKRNKIIGITSFGKGCGAIDSPGVYTRVSYYVPWIESVVWPN